MGKGFNRDSWARLEGYVRTLTDKYTNVYVCTGPLFLPQKEADGKMYIKYQVSARSFTENIPLSVGLLVVLD